MVVSLRSFVTLLIVVAAGTSAMAQEPPSLADIANKEQQRRQAITEPSKAYTNADLPQFERERASPDVLPLSCQSEEKLDSASGNEYLIQHCASGVTKVFGSNSRTGAMWQETFLADGSAYGVDKCGNRWTYDAKTTEYVNQNGERRYGESNFRARIETPAACDSISETRPTRREEYQPAAPPIQLTGLLPPAPPQVTYVHGGYGHSTRRRRPEPPPKQEPPPRVGGYIPMGSTGGMIMPCHQAPSGDPKRDAQVAALCR